MDKNRCGKDSYHNPFCSLGTTKETAKKLAKPYGRLILFNCSPLQPRGSQKEIAYNTPEELNTSLSSILLLLQ